MLDTGGLMNGKQRAKKKVTEGIKKKSRKANRPK